MEPLVQKIGVFLVEDHMIFRQSIAEVLQREKDIEVVGQCSTASEALNQIASTKPTVVLTELTFSGIGGLELLARLATVSPDTKPIVFSESLSERDLLEALRLGARGYAYKKISTDAILDCVRRVAAGEI